MAKNVKKSGLSAHLGDKVKKAIAAHKTDETDFGSGGNLPAGIEAGIAQLVECKFDTYKKGPTQGEYFFYAAGTVVEPKEHSGIPIEGLRTSIMEPMCDTPTRSRKTVDEHVAWVLNEFRKLGYDTEGMAGDDLEEVASALKEAKPHFRFRTWKGQPATTGPYKGKDPMTNHQWGKAVDYTPDADADESVVDETEEDEDDADETEEEETTEEETEDTEDTEEAEEESVDYKKLGKQADKANEEAQEILSTKAAERDIDPEDYDTWAALAAVLAEPPAEEEAEEDTEEEAEEEDEESEEEDAEGEDEDEEDDGGTEEDEEPPTPTKDGVYLFKPPKAKKAVECKAIAVFPKNQTVTLKNLDDGKTLYKAVPWDKLLEE